MTNKPLNRAETTRVLTKIIQNHFDELPINPDSITDDVYERLDEIRALIRVAEDYTSVNPHRALFPSEKVEQFKARYNRYLITPYLKKSNVYNIGPVGELLRGR